MIALSALGSGSGGNAFVLDGPDGALLVDAGFTAKELERRATLVGVDLSRVHGVVLTHEHGDHATGSVRIAKRLGVPLVATEGTLRSLAPPEGVDRVMLRSSSIAELGPFSIESCRIIHDAAEPTALAVEYQEVRLGVAYDFGRATLGLRHLLRGCDALVVESNYDEIMLRTSDYPVSVQHRIAGSGGHLSNRAAAELLADLCHDGLGVVVLAHLSRQCNAPEVAHSTVAGYLGVRGFTGRIAVATQDTPVGPLPISASGARHRLATQCELEFS
ncbi:MAG: MBL fold metallo-hydrolase [Gemmatimonadales bacterium]|nr:MBL fold metallo-hydrolase [Gemmatimonadales bacterium]